MIMVVHIGVQMPACTCVFLVQSLFQITASHTYTHIHPHIHKYTHIHTISDSSPSPRNFHVEQHISNQLPVRFGIIFESQPVLEAYENAQKDPQPRIDATPPEVDIEKIDEGEQLFRLFVALYEKHGRDAAFSFLSNYGGKLKSEHDPATRAELRKETFRQAAKENRALVKDENGKFTKVKYKPTLNSTKGAARLVASSQFIKEKGLSAVDRPQLVVNGLLLDDANDEALIFAVQMQMQNLQRMTYFGQLDEHKPVYEQIMAGPGVHKRYHKVSVRDFLWRV